MSDVCDYFTVFGFFSLTSVFHRATSIFRLIIIDKIAMPA